MQTQDRLVAAGVALVREGAELSLREIARRAGVSHGAPRRYFPTHQALLAAVAREGYRTLKGLVEQTIGEPHGSGPHGDAPRENGPRENGPHGDAPRESGPRDSALRDSGPRDSGPRDSGPRDSGPRDAVLALARQYVAFARAEPGMFALMFRHDLLRGNNIGLRQESAPLFGVLVKLLEHARLPQPTAQAAALWAAMHGIAQLWQWGSMQVATGLDDPEALLVAAVDAHLGG